jgi:hypothetical protein
MDRSACLFSVIQTHESWINTESDFTNVKIEFASLASWSWSWSRPWPLMTVVTKQPWNMIWCHCWHIWSLGGPSFRSRSTVIRFTLRCCTETETDTAEKTRPFDRRRMSRQSPFYGWCEVYNVGELYCTALHCLLQHCRSKSAVPSILLLVLYFHSLVWMEYMFPLTREDWNENFQITVRALSVTIILQ